MSAKDSGRVAEGRCTGCGRDRPVCALRRCWDCHSTYTVDGVPICLEFRRRWGERLRLFHSHKWATFYRHSGAWFNYNNRRWEIIVEQSCKCGDNRRAKVPATEEEILAVVRR